MLLGKTAADALSTAAAPFSDVAADRWSAGAVAYCASENIIAGKGDGTFGPTEGLTGYAFAKMCLVALGYDPEEEGLVGSDWSINTAKLARSAGLNDDLELAMGNVITREQAAQMALNTEKGTMVVYTGGTNITTTDGTRVVSGAVRSNVTSANNSIAADGFLQFGEECASTLTFRAASAASLDENGAPANKWTYKNKSVGDYPVAASYSYTSNLNNTAGKKTVKADLSSYLVTAALDTAVAGANYGIGTTGIQEGVDSDKIAAATGNGVYVDVYVKDNIIYAVTVATPILATVSKVESKKIALTGPTVTTVEDDDDAWAFFTGAAKGDNYIVVENLASSAIVEAYKPTEVSGKLTRIADATTASAKYTVDGTVYSKAAYAPLSGGEVANLKAGDLNSTRALLLDKFGYVVAADTVSSSDSYAFVLDAQTNMTKGEYNWAAQLLFADGTKSWVDVSKVGSKAVEDAVASDLTSLKMNTDKGFVTYKVAADGTYELTAATTEDDGTGAITKGTTTILSGGTAMTATNKTIFLVKNGSAYTVYTGIKNVPSMSVTKAYTQHTGTVANIVVVWTLSSTKNDQVFVYDTTSTGTSKNDNGDTLATYKAIVDGEKTTIDMITSGGGNTNGANVLTPGLHIKNNYNSDDAIAASGLSAVISANDTLGTSTVKYAAFATAGYDVWMKDGVVSIKLASTTSYVAADNFKAWLVDESAGKIGAEEITLDKDSTVGDVFVNGSSAWTLAAGDYVIYVLDSDNFITDLYLFNAA